MRFDPAKISYNGLLQVFWSCHDPTQLNRQGPDIGDQYRSVIFFHSPEQQRIAAESKPQLEESGAFTRPIVTTIEAAPTFWRAEEYHQRYLEKNSGAACSLGTPGGGR